MLFCFCVKAISCVKYGLCLVMLGSSIIATSLLPISRPVSAAAVVFVGQHPWLLSRACKGHLVPTTSWTKTNCFWNRYCSSIDITVTELETGSWSSYRRSDNKWTYTRLRYRGQGRARGSLYCLVTCDEQEKRQMRVATYFNQSCSTHMQVILLFFVIKYMLVLVY